MELQPYAILDDVIILAIKIKSQSKGGTSKVSKPYTLFSHKTKENKDFTKVAMVDKGKNKVKNFQHLIRSNDIKCLKCIGFGHIAFQFPNKKVMIIHELVEEVISEDESNP